MDVWVNLGFNITININDKYIIEYLSSLFNDKIKIFSRKKTGNIKDQIGFRINSKKISQDICTLLSIKPR